MKIIEISKQQFLSMLLNPNPYNQGQFGIITLLNNKLYKIYYKDFINTYITSDESNLDSIVDILLEIEKTAEYGLKLPSKNLEKFSRLLDTKSNDLITGVLSYRGLFIGIEMNCYDHYITLADAVDTVTQEEIQKYIDISIELVNDLMVHDIVPKDIKENNILVNTETGDVKLIDLDGIETIYGPKNYVKDYPYNVDSVNAKLEEMVNRLENKHNKYSKR